MESREIVSLGHVPAIDGGPTVYGGPTVAGRLTSDAAVLRHRVGRVGHAMSRVPSWVLLAAFVPTIAAINVVWRVLEARPPLWDMAYHLSNSLFYLHSASPSDPLAFVGAYRYYPPLTYWVTDVIYVALGNEAMWVAVLSNVVWLAVLVFATYGVGRRLWSARVGWVSVVFVVTAPIIVAASKQYELDMPLTAVAALTLWQPLWRSHA
jgi:4-amino-4-deoxy-L-arabinose transferase-like glycosyltransferase